MKQTQAFIQLSFFSIEETAPVVDTRTEYLKAELKRGTGFEDGKFRMLKYYNENEPSVKEFAEKLKKEYGIGGHSGNGNVRFADHDAKGIAIELKSGEELKYSWNEIAKVLAELIDNDEYIVQKDIDERIRHAKYIIKNCDYETADWYDKRQLDKAYSILSEYGITTEQ